MKPQYSKTGSIIYAAEPPPGPMAELVAAARRVFRAQRNAYEFPAEEYAAIMAWRHLHHDISGIERFEMPDWASPDCPEHNRSGVIIFPYSHEPLH